jgi:hypothetical protein
MLKHAVRPALLLLVAGVFAVAGCSTAETGNPSPSSDPPAGSTSAPTSPAAPTGSSPGGVAATSSIEPCSLLSVNDLTQYGSFSGPESKELGGARACGFQRQLASASDKELGVTVNVRDKQGIDSVNDLGNGKQTGKVNGRAAVKTSGAGACVIALGVGDSARVDVSITAGTVDEACTVVDKLADVVEPKLPKS